MGFLQQVSDEYRWVTGLLRSSGSKELILAGKRSGRNVDLQHEHALFRRFARLGDQWDPHRPLEEVLDAYLVFARKYGHLGRRSAIQVEGVTLEEGLHPVLNRHLTHNILAVVPDSELPDGNWVALETLTDWLYLSRWMAGMLRLVDALRDLDNETLQQMITYRSDQAFIHLLDRKGVPQEVRLLRNPYRSLLSDARLAVAQLLNECLAWPDGSPDVRYQLRVEDDSLVPAVEPANLRGLMLLQLAMEASGQQRTKPCQHCGEWLLTPYRAGGEAGKKRHAKFCSDLCRNAYHNARKPTTRAARKKRSSTTDL